MGSTATRCNVWLPSTSSETARTSSSPVPQAQAKASWPAPWGMRPARKAYVPCMPTPPNCSDCSRSQRSGTTSRPNSRKSNAASCSSSTISFWYRLMRRNVRYYSTSSKTATNANPSSLPRSIPPQAGTTWWVTRPWGQSYFARGVKSRLPEGVNHARLFHLFLI